MRLTLTNALAYYITAEKKIIMQAQIKSFKDERGLKEERQLRQVKNRKKINFGRQTL
jgi:hypothetical protein